MFLNKEVQGNELLPPSLSPPTFPPPTFLFLPTLLPPSSSLFPPSSPLYLPLPPPLLYRSLAKEVFKRPRNYCLYIIPFSLLSLLAKGKYHLKR